MTDSTVTMSDLIHRSRRVFDRLQHERRLMITNHGRVVGVLHAPDPDEAQLEQWVTEGAAATDWRERQAGLREWLYNAPVLSEPPGESIASAALLADREESGR